MAKSSEYPTMLIIGTPVIQNNDGKYQLRDNTVHEYRIGKHTKGKFSKNGQLFLNENNMMFSIVETKPLKFNQRHNFQPMGRFLTEFI